jgi:hypothetical protein
MISKKITFSATASYLEQKDNYPEPCKLNIPEWYKEIEHSPEFLTVKGCMPFLDTLTSGYLLKIPVDLYLEHNQYSKEGRYTTMNSNVRDINIPLNINRSKSESIHPPEQLGKCPFNQKNQNLPFQKIINPWIIKTPPGYSCLFLPPMNNSDDRFSIIPGIVDTDTFESEVNFPIIINGDKYPTLTTVIKKGTPYVQVIPFKRDSWKMEITNNENYNERLFFESFTLIHTYKTRWWNKKSWK